MRAATRNFIGLLALLTTLAAWAAGGNVEQAAKGWEMITAGALLVDVRSSEEYAEGHVEGAVNIAHTETAALAELIGPDHDRPVVLYCGSGRRAGLAQAALEALGYSGVFNATGYEALQATQP